MKLNITRKSCQHANCENKIFSRNYCKYHQYLAEKKIKISKDRGLFVREKIVKRKFNINEDWDFYNKIWEEREHYCFETGVYLGEEPLTTMFHHCLFKAKYPQFRYVKENILLLHPDVHSQVHTNVDRTPKVKEYTEETKKRLL